MKKALQLLLFITAIGFFGNLNATHIMGSDMTYKSLGNKKYLVTLTIYRDCRSSPIGTTAVIKIESNGDSATVTFNQVAVKDISPQCGGSTLPCIPANKTANTPNAW